MSLRDMSGASKRPGILASVGNRAPARNLSDAVKLCDPLLPLRPEDERLHMNLDPARGGDHHVPSSDRSLHRSTEQKHQRARAALAALSPRPTGPNRAARRARKKPR